MASNFGIQASQRRYRKMAVAFAQGARRLHPTQFRFTSAFRFIMCRLMGRPPRIRRVDGHRACLLLLELIYDHLNELIGRLDLSGADRIGLYKLRAIVERQLIAEGVLS